MGIKISTVTTCTCDICSADCSPDERRIMVVVRPAERDVGQSEIRGSILYDEPYGTRDGYICKQCKIKYLKKHIEDLENGR